MQIWLQASGFSHSSMSIERNKKGFKLDSAKQMGWSFPLENSCSRNLVSVCNRYLLWIASHYLKRHERIQPFFVNPLIGKLQQKANLTVQEC